MSEYGASSIQVLEGLSAVRKRPAMYIGSVSRTGLHHLVYEVVDNSVDEALGGHCDLVHVIFDDNKVSVVDNGRGIPVEPHPQYKAPALEIIMTKLHSGGKFDSKSYKVSGGLHGVGLSVVNALSSWLEITSRRNNKIYSQLYERGEKLTEVSSKPLPDDDEQKRGTTVTFTPDPSIFTETTNFDYQTIRSRMREMAYLTKGLRIIIEDQRSHLEEPKREEFYYEGGIKAWVHEINQASGKENITPEPIFIEGTKEEVMVEIAIAYNEGFNKQNIFSFANNINTREGGMHLTGFRQALTNSIKAYQKRVQVKTPRSSKKSKNAKSSKDEVHIEGEDVREGIVAVISVKLREPQFEGQTKMKLGNSEARSAVSSITYEGLNNFFDHHPKISEHIIKKALIAAEIRVRTKKVRDQARKSLSVRPENFVPCRNKDPKESEIFIVEGRSAGGSAKSGRDPKTQAILMLRGKVINVEKNSMIKVLDNKEIQSMISILGTDIDDSFDIDKLKYHKVIIMTDADVDGAHIRTLLLTFFFRHMLALIERGNLFIAQPPFYSISRKGKKLYFYTDEELDKWKKENTAKVHVQRYKGLGEMNSSELADTTMDKQKRHLWKVTIDETPSASELFTILMGDNVALRKQYIQEHAKDSTVEIDV
ncbi:MAG: DNA gyrase/topoisomerase IV subunit B [Candidatus Hodarchaeales archaeon]